jgi:hypothetical protein
MDDFRDGPVASGASPQASRKTKDEAVHGKARWERPRLRRLATGEVAVQAKPGTDDAERHS